jgi:hypothetical protein
LQTSSTNPVWYKISDNAARSNDPSTVESQHDMLQPPVKDIGNLAMVVQYGIPAVTFVTWLKHSRKQSVAGTCRICVVPFPHRMADGQFAVVMPLLRKSTHISESQAKQSIQY